MLKTSQDSNWLTHTNTFPNISVLISLVPTKPLKTKQNSKPNSSLESPSILATSQSTMQIHFLLAQLFTTTALASIYPRNVTTVAAAGDKSNKEAAIPSNIGSVICVSPGQTATATWVNALRQRCTWTGVVGSNFGPRGNGNEYVSSCGNAFSIHFLLDWRHGS